MADLIWFFVCDGGIRNHVRWDWMRVAINRRFSTTVFVVVLISLKRKFERNTYHYLRKQFRAGLSSGER